jgi:hypothetical protein
MIKGAVISLAFLIASATVWLVVASLRWTLQSRSRVAQLELGHVSSVPMQFSQSQLRDLPPPVARYFTFAIPKGALIIHRAHIVHAGEFSVRAGNWAPFRSEQYVRVRRPAFVWDARIRMNLGATNRVRDSYVDGIGSMQASIMGAFPLANVRGTPEIASSALARYLAECAWYPTALLPSSGVRWETIDDSTARATVVDGNNSVSVDFHFAADGSIAGISGERYRDVNGRGVLTHWQGSFREYRDVNGFKIPMAGEVTWVVDGGPLPYWRARIERISYH